MPSSDLHRLLHSQTHAHLYTLLYMLYLSFNKKKFILPTAVDATVRALLEILGLKKKKEKEILGLQEVLVCFNTVKTLVKVEVT